MLECDHCGSKFTPQQIEDYYAAKQVKHAPDGTSDTVQATQEEQAAAAADPIQNYLKRSKWDKEEQEQLRGYTCSSCGAELITDKTTAVTNCPYCGNPTVLPGQLDNILRPQYVIPFKYNKQQAIDTFKNYYSTKKLLPKGFSNDNHLAEIQGVYVPFWLYTVKAEGSASFRATRSTVWADTRNTYVKTDYYQAIRDGVMTFEKVPVDASSKMPDAHMDAIEPFDYSELQPFSVGYLPGYLTDRYDENSSDCQQRAQERMEQSTSDMLASTVTGYESVAPQSCSVNCTWQDAAYALLPVWMLHTTYNGEDLLFAMNGQTGKLVGDLPVDTGKAVGKFFTLFIPTALAFFALFAFLFLG